MSDKSKMLERVRALLAKAASTTFPAEADAFREKADQIMTNYAIEQWQVDALGDGHGKGRMPIRRDFGFDWYRSNPFRDQLWLMFNSVAEHCRVVPVGQKVSWSELRIPVIGLESDLDWFDLLYTNLQIAMIQKVDPQPSRDLGLNENLALMREAGMPWEPAIERIIRLGTMKEFVVPENATFDKVYKPWVHGYRAWCRRTGYKQSYVNQNTFRRGFADGFTAEIGDRLWHMKRESERAYDANHDAGSMALAVRDIKQVIAEAVFAEFPDLRPHAKDCKCARCERRRAEMRKPVRTYGGGTRERIDHAAVQAGRAAGRDVNLSNNPSERIGARKSIKQ